VKHCNYDSLLYSKSISHRLEEYVELLKSYMFISVFGYLKIFFDNNRYYYVCSDCSVTEDYILNVKNTLIFYEKNLKNTQEGYQVIFWPKIPSHYSMEIYLRHGYWNGITFLKEHEDYVELYWFASDLKNTLMNDFYIKNCDTLTKSLNWFSNKNKDMFNVAANKNLSTFIGGVDFSNIKKLKNSLKLDQERVEEFLRKVSQKKIQLNTPKGHVHLTHREIECLKLISEGNTLKEAANDLNLSFRTVEEYLSRVKHKTGLVYKSNLVKLYRNEIAKFFI